MLLLRRAESRAGRPRFPAGAVASVVGILTVRSLAGPTSRRQTDLFSTDRQQRLASLVGQRPATDQTQGARLQARLARLAGVAWVAGIWAASTANRSGRSGVCAGA